MSDESLNATVPRRVLIVDDSETSARIVARIFTIVGPHEVRTAGSGQEALDAVSTFQPHLVVLDILLPDMNGCDVATRIRGMPNMAGARLVALTGLSDPDQVAEYLAAGFDEHLGKPASLDQLADLLNRIA